MTDYQLAGCLEWTAAEQNGYGDDGRSVLSLWRTFKGDGVGVGVKYRTANAVGAKILKEEIFVMRKDGMVARVIEPRNLKVPVAK